MSREIDRKIAELLGYSVIVSDTYDYWYYSEKYKGEVPIPPFSKSWEAMRLVVEWLQGKAIAVIVEHEPDGKTSVGLYADAAQLSYSIESSAPLALCQAFLNLPPGVLE